MSNVGMRGVIVIALAGCGLVACAQVTAVGLASHGAHLYSRADSQFTELLDKNGGALSEREDLAPHLAEAVMLHNTSAHSIAGYSLKWVIVAPDGKTQTYFQEYSEPPAFDVGQRLKFGVLPGDYKLITPYFSWTSRMLGALTHASTARAVPNDGLAKTIAASRTTTVTLDGIFFEDGSFEGADDSHFFEHMTHETNARSIIGSYIHNALAQHQSNDAIVSYLTEKAEAGQRIDPATTVDSDLESFYEGRQAQAFLRLFQVNRVDMVQANAALQASEQPIRFTKK